MEVSISVPLLVISLLLVSTPSLVLSFNITTLLSTHLDLSAFTHLLTSTSVAADLYNRSSLTILAVPNSVLLRKQHFDDLKLAHSSSYDIADVLRYHVLLQYLSPTNLNRTPPEGKMVTTLFQTTGRAYSNTGAVNITRNPVTGSITVSFPTPYSATNATILSLVETLPYNITIFTVDSLLIPTNVDVTSSENRPPPVINITQVLMDGKDFNVVSSMLTASGDVKEFETDEKGAGITIFVPTDEAFTGGGRLLQSLPAFRKATVLRYHVLHSYYPLGSLEIIVNPVQPTLATEDTGAGMFTLNISRINGSIAIDTGIVQASITRTVFDQNPVAVFAVSMVLLPKEMFGNDVANVGGITSSTTGRNGYAPNASSENGNQVVSPPLPSLRSSSDFRSGSVRGTPLFWWYFKYCIVFLLFCTFK